MALSTYSDLASSVADWINRSDLTARVPDFIALAESKMNARIEHRKMQTIATISITGETYTFPDAFGGMISFRLDASGYERIEYLSPEQFDELPVNTSGTPRYYTIAGEGLVFWPIPGDAISARLRYRTRLTPLSADDPSNWVLANYPHAYLYGALSEATPYLKDDERIPVWTGAFNDALQNINDDSLKQGLGAAMQTQSGVYDNGARP